MFYYISGELALTDSNTAVIDAGGIGYKLNVSGNTLGKLASDGEGSRARLYTYMSVREDAIELFGFYTKEELAAFKLLISVSGVGAKSAMSVLSLLSPEGFARAVSSGDSKSISRAQGIGAKTAARIVLDLKDKIAKEIETSDVNSAIDTIADSTSSGSEYSEALNALLVLGYSRSEAAYALRGLSTENAGIEDLIRQALKKLMKQ